MANAKAAAPAGLCAASRNTVGALRTRLVAVKNQDCSTFPYKNEKGEYAEGVMLDLDLWVVLPR